MIDRLEIEVPTGSTALTLLQRLAIELPPDALLIAVNGRVVTENKVLADGDRVNLMPAISGGCDQLDRSS